MLQEKESEEWLPQMPVSGCCHTKSEKTLFQKISLFYEEGFSKTTGGVGKVSLTYPNLFTDSPAKHLCTVQVSFKDPRGEGVLKRLES